MRSPRTHALIVAHPNPDSFAVSAARIYKQTVESLGHRVIERDLYRLCFDPCLRNDEIPRAAGFVTGADICSERAAIGEADVFVFFYPLWLNTPPAILTGYLQRVFGPGFGYAPQPNGVNQRLLLGRAMLSFSTSGAPAEWLKSEGGWDALWNLFDEHFSGVCGLSVLDHRHFGRMLASTPPARIEAHFKDVRDTATRLFDADPRVRV